MKSRRVASTFPKPHPQPTISGQLAESRTLSELAPSIHAQTFGKSKQGRRKAGERREQRILSFEQESLRRRATGAQRQQRRCDLSLRWRWFSAARASWRVTDDRPTEAHFARQLRDKRGPRQQSAARRTRPLGVGAAQLFLQNANDERIDPSTDRQARDALSLQLGDLAPVSTRASAPQVQVGSKACQETCASRKLSRRLVCLRTGPNLGSAAPGLWHDRWLAERTPLHQARGVTYGGRHGTPPRSRTVASHHCTYGALTCARHSGRITVESE